MQKEEEKPEEGKPEEGCTPEYCVRPAQKNIEEAIQQSGQLVVSPTHSKPLDPPEEKKQ